MTDGHPSGSVTRLRELVEQWEEQVAELKVLLRREYSDAVLEATRRSELETLEMVVGELRPELAAALAPAVVPSVDDFVVPVEVVNRRMADVSAMIRKLEHERDAAETVMLEELHGLVASMPMRVEVLGGQRTTYVQRATLLDWIEVELEKRLKSAAPPVVAPVATPPALRDNGKPNKPHDYDEDPETGCCVICGWAECCHDWPVAAPVQEQEDLPGLNLDMLDADRLRLWASRFEEYGPNITEWGSREFVIHELRRIADGIAAEVHAVGQLRALAGEYLGNGGLFNPESMDHQKVSGLIRELRDAPPRPQGESDAE